MLCPAIHLSSTPPPPTPSFLPFHLGSKRLGRHLRGLAIDRERTRADLLARRAAARGVADTPVVPDAVLAVCVREGEAPAADGLVDASDGEHLVDYRDHDCCEARERVVSLGGEWG